MPTRIICVNCNRNATTRKGHCIRCGFANFKIVSIPVQLRLPFDEPIRKGSTMTRISHRKPKSLRALEHDGARHFAKTKHVASDAHYMQLQRAREAADAALAKRKVITLPYVGFQHRRLCV